MKRTTMELGGHGPVLVFDDVDVDQVLDVDGRRPNIAMPARSASSPTRFIVQEDVFERFRRRLHRARAKAINVGDGLDAGHADGPDGQSAPARGDGAADRRRRWPRARTLHTGGERIGNQGYFYAPTVLSDVPLDAEIMNEEPFGPVAHPQPLSRARRR